MRIDINEVSYHGSYEQIGQDFIIRLDREPDLIVGEEAIFSVYDEHEELTFTAYNRTVQSIEGLTVRLHIEEEPSEEQDMREALEILGVI